MSGAAAAHPFLTNTIKIEGREFRNSSWRMIIKINFNLCYICNSQDSHSAQAQNFPIAGPGSGTIGYGHDAEHDPSYRPYGFPPDTLIPPDRAQGIAQPDVPSDRRRTAANRLS